MLKIKGIAPQVADAPTSPLITPLRWGYRVPNPNDASALLRGTGPDRDQDRSGPIRTFWNIKAFKKVLITIRTDHDQDFFENWS